MGDMPKQRYGDEEAIYTGHSSGDDHDDLLDGT